MLVAVVGTRHYRPHPPPPLFSQLSDSVADPGCLSRIPDRNFFHPDPSCEFFSSRIRIKEFNYFYPKKIVSKLSEI